MSVQTMVHKIGFILILVLPNSTPFSTDFRTVSEGTHLHQHEQNDKLIVAL